MRSQLAAIEAGGERIAELDRRLLAAREAYAAAADALSAKRHEAAARLDSAVALELAPLKLDAAKFRTALVATEPGPSGTDRVEFEVSTNPGAPFGPLTRIASGGELSRFILALKVALAEAGSAATMIFDEVDRGVGGAVASAIGERLARLAQQSQVLVVTHSPQVAARAAHHYRIEKAHGPDGTRTSVRKLSADERREEIARMLSGASITEEARAQASRLLDAA
jgi:DNA repair protein RecN (Recombination protein N)